jgi:hypothetical protein
MLRHSISIALVVGTALTAGCAVQGPAANNPAPVAATAVAPSATAVAPFQAAISRAPLTTSSGFRLDSPDPRPIQGQLPSLAPETDGGLRTIHAPKGAEVLSPTGWRALPPATLAQQVCVQGTCVQVEEDILVLAAPDGRESLAVFGVDVPPELPSDGAVLAGLVRGVVTGFSGRAPDTKIVDGPAPFALPGASQATALRAVFTEPATGTTATMFVEAASQGQRIGGVFVVVPDTYLQAHADEISRVRSSFRLGTIANE